MRPRHGTDPPDRERPAGRPGAGLRLVIDNGGNGEMNTAANRTRQLPLLPPPAPLTAWQREFLRSLAGWPFELHPGQRATLRWISES